MRVASEIRPLVLIQISVVIEWVANSSLPSRHHMALEAIGKFEIKGTLSAWPYWRSPTARWEDELDMKQLFRELLAMTGREKELAITSNTMLRGLHRYGLHEFDGQVPPLIDQITFIPMACHELEKMKKTIQKPLIARSTPITPITKPQSSPSLAGDDT